MKIEMPIPQKVSTNSVYSGKHWTYRKKIADIYHQSLLPFRNMKVKEYPVDITYVFTFKGNPLDSSNTSLMGKLLEDGMVRCGILEDDDWKHVSFSGFYTQKGDSDTVEIYIA